MGRLVKLMTESPYTELCFSDILEPKCLLAEFYLGKPRGINYKNISYT